MSNQDSTHAHEKNSLEGKEAVSLTDISIEHFKSVLRDKDATDTAKTNAANGLAQIERTRLKAAEGTIHRLSRSDLTHEIARIQAKLATMA